MSGYYVSAPHPPTNAHSIIPIFSKLCRCFGYCLKMCMWFGHYPTHLTTINTVFHPCDKSILISNKNIILNICKTIFRHRFFFFLIQYMLFGLNLFHSGSNQEVPQSCEVRTNKVLLIWTASK